MAEAREPEDAVGPATTYNLLFVCTGNTCRSPMAAAIARSEVEKRGWSNIEVASAGIGASPGSPASEHAVRVAAEHGLDLTAHRSRQLDESTVAWADMILAMGPAHVQAIEAMGGAGKVWLVGGFLDAEHPVVIDDPFGGDIVAYARTFEQLEVAVDAVLDRLEPILAP